MLIKQENLRFKTFRMKNFIFLEILFEYTLKLPILCLQMFQLCVTHFTEVCLEKQGENFNGYDVSGKRESHHFEERCYDGLTWGNGGSIILIFCVS